MSVEIRVEYRGDLRCEAKHVPSGQTITTDAPVDNGGRGEAFSPTDLLAAAYGTCIMTIMALVAKRSGVDIRGATVRVVKEMATAPSRRLGSLDVTVTLPPGLKLSDADRRKLEAAAKACPVHESLHPEAKINTKFVYQ
ncbi:MAG: OsmC family protein [Planctomycetota bacterium]|nr:OsmC family protein [Planctomycetota bacterium]